MQDGGGADSGWDALAELDSPRGPADIIFVSIKVSEPHTRMAPGGFKGLGGGYTAYVCVGVTSDGKTLEAERRYSEFQTLRRAIGKYYPALAELLPELPEKKAFGRFRDSFVEKRRAGLEEFLEAMLEHQRSYRFLSQFMQRFLTVNQR